VEEARASGWSDDVVLEACGISMRFGDKVALQDVTVEARAAEIHALLGPNGAGKTTLLRILAGLLSPTAGVARVAGVESTDSPRELRRLIGVVPSGDRTFYLRISGVENLVFFARLNGLRLRAAQRRAHEVLDWVGLANEGGKPVGLYSHGMQKRLSVARAFVVEPAALLVDEATHDLDPEGAERIRALVREIAGRGTAVLWTTQRIDEIRGLAGRVTLLGDGTVRFAGTVPGLMAHATPARWVLRVRAAAAGNGDLPLDLQGVLGDAGSITRAVDGDTEHYLLSLEAAVTLGEALARLAGAGVEILACREERSEIESAFLALTGGLE
jgi:ABC-type multidrug transport system ATPase subunit